MFKVHHTSESLDLERKVSVLRELGLNRQSKIFFTTQYGERLGEIRFKELQTIQALTNSKEYKGMTDEEFEQYNHSRATTLKNMIKRYGEEEGTRIFNEYRETQKYKKSKQRYIDEDTDPLHTVGVFFINQDISDSKLIIVATPSRGPTN